MITGCKNMDRTDIWHAQAIVKNGVSYPNSAIECMLRKDEIQEMQTSKPAMWLETCGSHSNVNAMMGTRKDPDAFLNSLKTPNHWYPRPPDILTLWMNTPQNYSKMLAVRPGLDPDAYFGNEVPQYYPTAMKEVFDVSCQFIPSHQWSDLVAALKVGTSIVICLKKPGHYICAIGFDDATNEIIYVDPNAPRQTGDWKKARMKQIEHDTNTQPFIITYVEEI
jgi:hypothetical protein